MTTCVYLFALFVLENYLLYDTRPPSITFTGIPCYLPLEFGIPVPLLLSLSTPSPMKVLGKLPVPGRPTNLDYSRAGDYCACSRCGWGLFGHFFSHL